jgi:hypothetical protein
MNKELQKFKDLFDRDKFKIYPDRIEYRVSSLEHNVAAANRLIDQHKLKLKIVSNGQLATYKAFEVKLLQ